MFIAPSLPRLTLHIYIITNSLSIPKESLIQGNYTPVMDPLQRLLGDGPSFLHLPKADLEGHVLDPQQAAVGGGHHLALKVGRTARGLPSNDHL